MLRKKTFSATLLAAIMLLMLFAAPALAADGVAKGSSMQWWMWPLVLFFSTLAMGVVAVLGGVGGGVLFTPIVGSFFPFGMNFVKAAGLLVALSGSVAAGPGLLKKGLADLRLAIPVALMASIGSIIGAQLGIFVSGLPGGKDVMQIALGVVVLGIVVVMLKAKKSDFPEVKKPDKLSSILKLTGIYHESATNQEIDWKIHKTPIGLVSFIFIGVLAGMFGLGAGWANVPVLNLLMGAPLKVSVATSKFLLSITDTSAAWVYFNNGAAIPLIIVPSIIGIMLGSFIGVRLLPKTKPNVIKVIVIIILCVSATSSILKGVHIMK
ncbi:MAG: sulfite exporter TauE/SafE family protein [Candidatus Aquicultor sp.]